jgi:hypothetical protein
VPANAARLSVRIWDSFGDYVGTPVDEANPAAGKRVVEWPRTSAGGQTLPPGPFIWRVTVDRQSESRLVYAH